MTLTDAQAAAIQAIIDNANTKLKPVPNAKPKPHTSSSLFGASSGVSKLAGSTAELKVRSDAAATAALKDASPAEILQAWCAAQTSDGEDPNQSFLNAFRTGRK